MFNTDRYILVSTYVEYNRLLEYWRSNLGEYEIIYAVDSVDIISEELFDRDNILIAAWLHEEDFIYYAAKDIEQLISYYDEDAISRVIKKRDLKLVEL